MTDPYEVAERILDDWSRRCFRLLLALFLSVILNIGLLFIAAKLTLERP